MNKYIKLLVESFFDDIEDDVLDTNDALATHNISMTLDNYIDQVKRTFKKVHDISYNKRSNTCTFIVDLSLIVKTDDEVNVFQQIVELLSNIGCKCIYINDVGCHNVGELLISPLNKNTTTFNGYNIVIDTRILHIYDMTIKNVRCSVEEAILLRCNLQYSDTCIINSTDLVKVLLCTNIHNFSFIENNVRYIMFWAEDQKYMPVDKSFVTIPKSCERLSITISDNISYHGTELVKFDKDNLLNGIENIKSVILKLESSTFYGLQYIMSCISIEKFLVNCDKLNRMLLLYHEPDNTDTIFKLDDIKFTLNQYETTEIPYSVLKKCKNNKIYYLNKYITAAKK